jgi:hypothetical protein
MLRNVNRQLQEDKGVTIRFPSTAFFGVSSADRYKTIQERRSNPSFPFAFNISKNESLLNGFFHRFALTEFRMDWALPNISSVWSNNKILLKVTGQTPFLITVPDGFYTPKDLADVIEQIVDVQFPTINFTATTDKSTGIITFSATPTFQFSPDPANTSPFKQLFDMLNFYWNPIGAGTTLATSAVSGVPNLRYTDYIDIVCNQITAVQDVKDVSTALQTRDVLCRIYLDETTPSDATYQNPVQTEIRDGAFAVTGYNTPDIGSGAKQNGVRPLTIYRQFANPKQIKWEQSIPLGQVIFEIYDDEGRSIQQLLQQAITAGNVNVPRQYATACEWNCSILISEN